MIDMPSVVCSICSKKLSKDEIGLNKKLIDENAEDALCITCLSEYYGCSVHDLECKIEEFKEEGCKHFM